MKFLNLFIDESGQSNPQAYKTGAYILCGCLVNQHTRSQLHIKADQIKFKFWDKTNLVFHSREIWRKKKEFSILKDDAVRKKFEKHLFNFLLSSSYQVFVIVVDHQKAAKQNWNSQKVYKETSNIMVKNFILALLATGKKGRLVIESATSEKDFNFHKAAGHYLANGIPELGVKYQQIQDVLTEVSFVTKKNFDIEEQIADLITYGAKLKFLNKKRLQLNDYDKKILKVFEQKLFRIHPHTGIRKKKFYSKIKSFKSLP